MKFQICAIRDRAVASFQRPFFAPAIGAAIRAFGDEINRQGSEMHAHPSDYDLFHLGEFDDETAKFTTLEQPKQIAIGDQLKGA